MLPENPRDEAGTIYLENANVSQPPLPEGVRIHALRINSIHGQPTPSVPHRGKVRQEIVKRIEGYAPVNGKGSASFRAPANLPLQLQALDESGMAVMTMRSFIYLQPGENLSCVGCHEQRASSPPRAHQVAIPDVAELTPPAGPRYPGGFSYMKSVQPVLDRHCISCHGLTPKPAAKLNLLGTQAVFPVDGYPGWPRDIHTTASYESLLHRPGLVRIAQRNEETASSKPDDYFARAGKLARFLLGGHCPSLLEDRDGLRRIIDWLDLNAQYNGDYSWNRAEDRQAGPEGEKALRAFLTRRFGAEVAAQPFAALVNVGLPEQSRVLLAALPAEANGWGQLPNLFPDRNDPAYQELQSLVRQAIVPAENKDHEGTCGQTPCICGSCWVREAEQFWRQRTPTLAIRPE
jgi:mono/diheme cytochrome c family protein